jgi:hypothetical protein
VKSAGACIGELFALAIFAATPACSEKVTVATILDAGIDAMTMTACGALDGGMVGCPDGSFCSLTSCGPTGTCETIPPEDSCGDAGYHPECACNEVTYFNSCLRRAATASPRNSDACPLSTTNPPCSPYDKSRSCEPGQSCLPIFPLTVPPSPFGSDAGPTLPFASPFVSDAGPTREECAAIFPFLPTTCWVLPKTCASSGTRLRPCGGDHCLYACDALKNGGAYLTCPGP